jgi:hypothetical protein
MPDLSHYTPGHRAELERLLDTPAWQGALGSGLVEKVRAGKIPPGQPRNFIGTVVDQLLALNQQRVEGLIAGGLADEVRLLDELARWPLDLEKPLLSFLGLNLTARCNFDPRCIYCNQPWIEPGVDLEGWKRIIEAATTANSGVGPYIYLTGGEPLVLGEALWGDEGLVRFASQRGAAVNVNTNAFELTPAVALALIKGGLSRLHISLDTADEAAQNRLFGGERMGQVLEGIYNVQLARDLAGVSYPEIHTNCVLTNQNLDAFPGLLSLLLEKRGQVTRRGQPLADDLLPHVIPVGGSSNDSLRPDAGTFRRFFEEIWPQACQLWDEYQDGLGVPADQRRVLFGYFSNPFLRVEHQGGLEAYIESAVAGHYGERALSRHCYVAPTQASFTPDGLQFRCGSHAIRRLQPLGSVTAGDLHTLIRAGIPSLDALPTREDCYGCALATLYINQAVEKELQKKVGELLAAGR